MGRQPHLRFVLNLLIAGIFPVFYACAGFALRKQWWKAVLPIFAVHYALLSVLALALPDVAQPPLSAVNRQLTIDAIAIMAAVSLGYGCFLYVSIAEFRRYFRLHAEMELASEIHHVLVPAINTRIGGFEFYGRSAERAGGGRPDRPGGDGGALGGVCGGCFGPWRGARRGDGDGEERGPDAAQFGR
jgi:hypothetical protein